jgi:CheY-like chemotaxis protein
VAHDFNNVLTVIANAVALAKREPGLSAPAASHLEVVALATERAADLCRQMLAYAGKARIERDVVDLSALIAEMASILEASIARRATLVRELAPALPSVLGDGTQIRQVVMNLVLNAAEAISAPLGTIRISTGTGTYDAAAFVGCPAGSEPKAGAYVWLEVDDDGVGMDDATRGQMFDPFFTTKFVGRGLGMAAVLGIVRGHQGVIEVESTPGRGTRVRVLFPVHAAEPRRRSSRAAPKEPGNSGVVLLVEDDANVRLSTELLLRESGFDVLVARDGLDAVEVFQAEHARVDAVLLDLTMPRMDGVKALRELRRIAPCVPVVLTTGYAKVDPAHEADAVLPKPYTEDRLFATIQRAIEGRQEKNGST